MTAAAAGLPAEKCAYLTAVLGPQCFAALMANLFPRGGSIAAGAALLSIQYLW